MKLCYKDFNFRQKSLGIIEQANKIIREYAADDYDLTLRQLYYKFVADDLFPDDRRWSLVNGRWKKDPNGTKNAEPNYKWLGSIINDARLAGLVDWNSIVDRTREYEKNGHWRNPSHITTESAECYGIDTRASQEYYLEVWVEKDALVGVLERACTPLDVGYFSCRGYVSQSAMWQASNRLKRQGRKERIILHLGDHDPSGINMTEDIQNRLHIFGVEVNVKRIALNMEQVEEYQPPPNPAKTTDSRYERYISEYGEESWELDALDPRVITELIEQHVEEHTDEEAREVLVEKQESDREKLQEISDNWKD